MTIELCAIDNCRLKKGHKGKHNKYPENVWKDLFDKKDIDKVSKAGYATPRGGDKGAYQNHVYRNNKVIIPYERLRDVNLNNYKDGYIIRLFPNQYFKESGIVKDEFLCEDNNIIVGENAFVLYRTHDYFEKFPPLNNWSIRHLEKDGKKVTRRGKNVTRRGKNVIDIGHYVLRMSTISDKNEISEGAPQGIFAPEYADVETNYLCKCLLAWLIIKSVDSPYNEDDFSHLKLILESNNLLDLNRLNEYYIINNGYTSCPLCHKKIKYNELHEMISFDGASGLANSQSQIEGATRSTTVNLFHMVPLVYESLEHKPDQVAWGHAICNTRLGQRECTPLSSLKKSGNKVSIINIDNSDTKTLGWISSDKQLIRSDNGDVWIKITDAD